MPAARDPAARLRAGFAPFWWFWLVHSLITLGTMAHPVPMRVGKPAVVSAPIRLKPCLPRRALKALAARRAKPNLSPLRQRLVNRRDQLRQRFPLSASVRHRSPPIHPACRARPLRISWSVHGTPQRGDPRQEPAPHHVAWRQCVWAIRRKPAFRAPVPPLAVRFFAVLMHSVKTRRKRNDRLATRPRSAP